MTDSATGLSKNGEPDPSIYAQSLKQLEQSDDIALIFLNKSSTTATAVANLDADRTAGKILNIYADAPGATPLASNGE